MDIFKNDKEPITLHTANKYCKEDINVIIKTDELTVTPNAEEQIKEGLYNKVTVAGDSNLVPENIKEGTSVFGIAGKAKTTNTKISNCAYLFYLGNRIDETEELIKLISDDCQNFGRMFYEGTNVTEVPLFNTSNGTDFTGMFYGTRITELPEFDTSNGKIVSLMFSSISTLETVPLLNLGKAQFLLNMFQNCYSLKNLGGFKDLGKAYTVKGNNYNNYTLNLNQCSLLTHDSLINVINNLYDLNLTYDVANGGTLYRQSLVLGSTNLAKLTAEEITIATNKGWNVT